MARYFFNVRGSDGTISRDREGQDLPSLEAARAEAVSSNREMLGERLLHGGSLGPREVEIVDEGGKVLATVTAEDVLMRDGQFIGPAGQRSRHGGHTCAEHVSLLIQIRVDLDLRIQDRFEPNR